MMEDYIDAQVSEYRQKVAKNPVLQSDIKGLMLNPEEYTARVQEQTRKLFENIQFIGEDGGQSS